MEKRLFYISTPIYYINDVPHLGSAYTTIAADIMARYHRLRGAEARFLTGTDEHGLKVQRAAEERGITPDAFADEMSGKFRDAWPKLGCAPDDFIRTSEPRHRTVVQEIWQKIADKGDLYLGHYEGLYCVSCEAYYTEKELAQPGNLCPTHRRPVESMKEESYFFRLSRYQDRLLQHIAENPSFIEPQTRLNEVVSFVKEGLADLSVSRTTFKWGVPVPGDPKHVMYVWFDALANYYTALTSPTDNTRFWPSAIHLIGKDIVRFHAVYWPAFLMAADMPPPKQIFAHGFLTYNGQKMSKTLRNTISPVALAQALSSATGSEIGADVVRYCLMRSISFGQDGDFSIDDVLQRYASELGNALGNLLNRVLPFADAVPEKGPITALEETLLQTHTKGAAAAAEAFDALSPTRALDAIWSVIMAANAYVDKAAPWAAKKNDPARLGTIVATLVELLAGVSLMISPVLPTVADKMREQLGLPPVRGTVGVDQWPLELARIDPGKPLKKGEPIFPRFEKEKIAEIKAAFSPPPPAEEGAQAPADAKAETKADAKTESAGSPAEAEKERPAAAAAAAAAAKGTIAYEDFTKLDIRVGVVLSAERVKKKDKLLDLRIDTGDAAPRRIVAGIAMHYTPEALVGRRVVVLCNLAPREFGKGLVSEGMLLAASGPESVRALSVEGEVAPGTTVK
jgi:methionyl-tRNA synthetase